MHRVFGRPTDSNPDAWDYFAIKTRWNPTRRGVDLYLINCPAQGGEERTKIEVPDTMDYHSAVTEIIEELLEDGWRER